MQIERITYQKTYNLGNYSSERIGIDAVLNEGDNPEEVFNQLKNTVDEYHINNLPVQIANNSPIEQVLQVKEVIPPLNKEEALIQAVESCTEVKVLESYRLLVKNNPVLQEKYDNHYKKLTNV